jgi:predicted DCC family thiol-disulfide oxidoreductase YuxK
MKSLPENKKIILFDGVCNLCNQSVLWIIKKDKKDIFRFVSLQSQVGQEILNYLNIDPTKTDSIILYEPNSAYYYKAEAAFKIAKELSGLASLLSILQFLPTFITNFGYDYIAKNRYQWFGKKDECMIPTPELKAKFIE